MSIDPQTHIGTVSLAVSDLGRSLDYYQHNIGLKLHRRENGSAYLGAGGDVLLGLHEKAGARAVRGTTGLYHFAILLPGRVDLARIIRHFVETETAIGGASDHDVSEALYLSDPDGNGIEIYADRPREGWQHEADGSILMRTYPLDIDAILAELEHADSTWRGLPGGTTIGHIHLHVAHLDAAEAFYTDVLGFDLMARYGRQAAFISAGGYHHHIGLNVWAGVGAPPPPPDAAGLQLYEIRLPHRTAVEQVVQRVRQAGIPIEQREDGYFLRDPSQNPILLLAE